MNYLYHIFWVLWDRLENNDGYRYKQSEQEYLKPKSKPTEMIWTRESRLFDGIQIRRRCNGSYSIRRIVLSYSMYRISFNL